ncbi:hypothetical protein HOT99_gp223 [Caulobacter phage CcrBL10]|uniref:Uncharacterized protein n=1 Tax=Caulobacter phage CcrBL10 TaxID=2283269 RepID=A0A385E978_9CAUD|nr:hypothetical protein HOT99_gp223 [Caulobacter phage CcrBL10]AXQ68394.1 hypothetical protein CcrBL10_gp190c [Caulobacter phage CcrBL10]
MAVLILILLLLGLLGLLFSIAVPSFRLFGVSAVLLLVAVLLMRCTPA